MRKLCYDGRLRYKAALFDFDGTLADSADWCIEAINEIAGEFGFRGIRKDEFDSVRGMNTQQLIKHLGLPMWKLPALMVRMRKLAARDINRIKVFEGIPQMLRDLQSLGMQAAVVTSNSRENVEQVLGAENLALMRGLFCGASLLGKAPKLKAAARKLGTPPSECIYIGDEIRDATAAGDAGMDFGAVAWGYAWFEALKRQNPALAFQSIDQVATMLAA